MGKKIENYCLEMVIGEGEFGKVYKAKNQKTEQTVAIKVIKIEKYKISPRLEEFTINQIQTLSKIQDTTHIVKFIEILKTANNVYFVYEYCNGGTLQSLIKQNRYLSQQRAIQYFKDLLKAFKMLIKNNIMHRDIKPSNILIHNGVLKLADFGFCKPLKDARDLSQTMLGSPIYMAPEILKGELYTINADIWSLGVVLFQMLFGFCPFQERNIARLIDLINSSNAITFPTNIKISKKTEDLLKKMLVKDHFKRISWEQLFQYDLTPAPIEIQQTLRSKSPFMKKQFNSLTPSNTGEQNVLQAANNYSTKNNFPQNTRPVFKKVESTNIADAKIIKPILQRRNSLRKGILMVQQLLKRNNSKLTVYICCFLMRKVKNKAIELDKQIKSIMVDKQNYICTADIRKALLLVSEQKQKILPKVQLFEQQLKSIKLPEDIVYMRYAQEQGLTQQKDGLIQLLDIDDYLQESQDALAYNRLSKKQLLDEYERRIVRKQ